MDEDDSFTTNIAAPADKVWDLIRSQLRPAESESTTLLEKLPEITVTFDNDTRMADLVLVDHPKLDGRLRLVLSGPPDAPFLTVESDWTDRETGRRAGINDLARLIVLTMKSHAEGEF